MALTIETFPDLLRIVETHPEWRRKLIKALFPEVNLPKALQELAEAQQELARSQQRLESMMERLAANHEHLTSLYERLDTRVSRLETDVGVLKTDVGVLKGKSHERDYRDKAVSIFGRYLRRGRNVTNEVADQLQAAEEAGRISEQEFGQVLAADLLWGGQLRQAEGEVVLVVEASWLVEPTDVERAVARANILRKVGLRALPVVAGREWTQEAEEAAREPGAVMITDGRVDRDSWPNAW